MKMMMMMMMMMMYPGSSMTIWMYWIDPKEHILKVLCQYLYYWLRYRGYRGRGGKYFDDDDEEDDDNFVIDGEGQNEGQSVLWESERILTVSCQYL
jgi:hypothetical protein